ncbi:CxC ATPase DNA modification system associated small protein [Paraburkholderia tuberum]|uniref:Uncharacterized protein n=1 Tax=Paraburkholderia tuberum TaxID=157910 RepID=A0A1H1DV66_9BURK|nr:CxC ATPase DNA modification system associated small protein [Paraburkholderia tuberum]SDQ80411.1 hypothetical protein SAMN05445850_1792 [Paraburkholderia tuberum]
MSRVNENVVAALKAAASDADQPKEVAQRLVSWLDALATGNAVITDNDEAAKRISDLLDLVRIPSAESDLDDQDSEADL